MGRRRLQLLASLCSQSESATRAVFSHCSAALTALVSELDGGEDVLSKLNALEVLAKMASESRAAADELHRAGVLPKLHAMLDHDIAGDLADFGAFLLPGEVHTVPSCAVIM